MTGALALLAGVVLALAGASVPSDTWFIATACTLGCCALSGLWRRPWPRRFALLALGSLLAGCATLHWQALLLTTGRPDSRLLLEGTVITVPARFGPELGFDAEVIVAA